MMSHVERGWIPSSLKRFWRKESFLRLGSWEIRGSNVDRRFAVKSNSVRLSGISTVSRSWSWKLVRSSTVGEDDDSSSFSAFGSMSGGYWSAGPVEGSIFNRSERTEQKIIEVLHRERKPGRVFLFLVIKSLKLTIYW